MCGVLVGCEGGARIKPGTHAKIGDDVDQLRMIIYFAMCIWCFICDDGIGWENG